MRFNDGGTMRFARTMMALTIALSVAAPPTAGSASSIVNSAAMIMSAATDTEMSAAMDGCCPDQTKPCDQSSDQCQSMASCALHSINLADVAASRLKYPPVPESMVSVLTDQAVPLHGGTPPFRPPRV